MLHFTSPKEHLNKTFADNNIEYLPFHIAHTAKRGHARRILIMLFPVPRCWKEQSAIQFPVVHSSSSTSASALHFGDLLSAVAGSQLLSTGFGTILANCSGSDCLCEAPLWRRMSRREAVSKYLDVSLAKFSHSSTSIYFRG